MTKMKKQLSNPCSQIKVKDLKQEERELFHGKLEGLFNNPPVRASAGGKN